MTREFQYLESPQVAKLVDLILQLASEVHVSSHRVHSLELLLVRQGVLEADQLDGFEPHEDEARVLDQSRDALMDRLVRILTESGPAEHPLREHWEQALERKGDQ